MPLVMNKIKMNSFYGVRIPKAFESDENWYKINAYGGKELIIWSIPILLSGIICLFIPNEYLNNELLRTILNPGLIILGSIIVLIKIFLFANRL